jgi:hypothetical protein
MRTIVLPIAVKQMRAMVAFIIVLTMAPAHTFAGFFGNSNEAIIDAGGTVSEVAPYWSIACFREGQDTFGGVSSHKHCRIDNRDFRAIAIITADGLSIPYLPSRPACGGYSGKMKVDGKSIGSLPLRAKIAAMSYGITYARPYQTQWPDCRRFIEFTGLYGFSAALTRLKAQWRRLR